jgi:hypothetical protein
VDREQLRKRVNEIDAVFEEHVSIAGGMTDMLGDIRFLLDVALEHVAEPGPVQMVVPGATFTEPVPQQVEAEGLRDEHPARPEAAKPKRTRANTRPQGWEAT